jgi:hypothetical protein
MPRSPTGLRIVGVQRITGLGRGLESALIDITLGEIPRPDLMIACQDAIRFAVIRPMRRRGGAMAVGVSGGRPAPARRGVGVITKEHRADLVADRRSRSTRAREHCLYSPDPRIERRRRPHRSDADRPAPE